MWLLLTDGKYLKIDKDTITPFKTNYWLFKSKEQRDAMGNNTLMYPNRAAVDLKLDTTVMPDEEKSLADNLVTLAYEKLPTYKSFKMVREETTPFAWATDL